MGRILDLEAATRIRADLHAADRGDLADRIAALQRALDALIEAITLAPRE